MTTILLETSAASLDHDAGPWHPERPARIGAVLDGVRHAASSTGVELLTVAAPPAPRDALELVHPARHLDALEAFCESGGGQLDPDTHVGPASWPAALAGAGAGLDAVERLERGEAGAAFCVVRPPGHHATPTRAMGFCLLNNVAVTAAALAARGERVLVLDLDVHHGNGTQAAFWSDPRVAFVSFHQDRLYPHSGALEDTGGEGAEGLTLNVPFPAGTSGDAYRAAFDLLVEPLATRHRPTWVLLSAGFDVHRADPLAGIRLSAGDVADLVLRATQLVPQGRIVAFLEGGYDLDALSLCAGATAAALGGVCWRPEAVSTGSDLGIATVQAAVAVHHRIERAS